MAGDCCSSAAAAADSDCQMRHTRLVVENSDSAVLCFLAQEAAEATADRSAKPSRLGSSTVKHSFKNTSKYLHSHRGREAVR